MYYLLLLPTALCMAYIIWYVNNLVTFTVIDTDEPGPPEPQPEPVTDLFPGGGLDLDAELANLLAHPDYWDSPVLS